MAYATIQDAKELYGDEYVLMSVLRDDGQPDETAITRALEKASSDIDTYIPATYTRPLSPVPEVIEQYCIDIGIYRASATAGTTTDEKRRRFDDAIRWLTLLAKGTVTLPVDADADGTDDNDTSANLPEISGPDRVFSRCTMRGL